jgi:hypothetical protein
MSSSNLISLSGLAAVAAGVLLTIGDLLIFATETENLSEWARTTPYVFAWLLYLLGGVLLLTGLVGLYVRQSEAAGILGFVGFLVAFSGTVLALGAVWGQLFVAPFLAVQAPGALDTEPTGTLAVGFTLTLLIIFPLGWLLFGVATLRAQVYPRAAAILLIIGAVVGFLPIPLTEIVLNVAVARLGFVLFTGRGEAAQQPSRVS